MKHLLNLTNELNLQETDKGYKITGVASDNTIDSYGTVFPKNILKKMADTINTQKQIYFDLPPHSNEWSNVMGVVENAWIETQGDYTTLKVEGYLDQEHPFTPFLVKRLKNGDKLGFSVWGTSATNSAIYRNGSQPFYEFTDFNLKRITITSLPSNKNAYVEYIGRTLKCEDNMDNLANLQTTLNSLSSGLDELLKPAEDKPAETQPTPPTTEPPATTEPPVTEPTKPAETTKPTVQVDELLNKFNLMVDKKLEEKIKPVGDINNKISNLENIIVGLGGIVQKQQELIKKIPATSTQVPPVTETKPDNQNLTQAEIMSLVDTCQKNGINKVDGQMAFTKLVSSLFIDKEDK